MALLDVDDFKAVNDAYGHSTGDAVLRRIAAHWRTRVPTGDLLARIGGDEFGLLLPLTGLPTAHQTLQRLTDRDHRRQARGTRRPLAHLRYRPNAQH